MKTGTYRMVVKDNPMPYFLIPKIGNKNRKLMRQDQHLLLAPDSFCGNIPWKNYATFGNVIFYIIK
jgi:hypothetical protein